VLVKCFSKKKNSPPGVEDTSRASNTIFKRSHQKNIKGGKSKKIIIIKLSKRKK